MVIELGGDVTECICTLCLCCCMYCVCVSLCRCSFVCVRHSIFYVCVTCCDLDVTMRRHYKKGERRREGITTTVRMYHPKEKKR